jgi:hypoxanthine phosphoribosyltransferase
VSLFEGAKRAHPSRRRPAAQHFANEVERDFAHLLDLYGLQWSYEPRDFVLAREESGRTTRSFRPDFYLPLLDLYVEITAMRQALVTQKNSKIRGFRALYPEVRLEVLYRRDLEDFFTRHGLALPECRPTQGA